MNIRRVINPTGPFRLFVLSALLLAFIVLGLNIDSAKALGNVTLSASSYIDPDAEDTHKASQWVVRDSGATVFDSGADATNKTSITIPAATFTVGTTYFWKVRFQDNHDYWSDYSDEASFAYGSSPTVTPTPTSTSTITATATTTPQCNGAWADYNGDGIEECTDAGQFSGSASAVANTCQGGRLGFSFTAKGLYASTYLYDVYLPINGGTQYKRIIYAASLKSGAPDGDEITKTVTYDIAKDASFNSDHAKVLVHVYAPTLNYPDPININDYSYSGAFTSYNIMSGEFKIAASCSLVTQTPVPTSCGYDILSPVKGDDWSIGSAYQIVWTKKTGSESFSPDRANVTLSTDDGKTYSLPIQTGIKDEGAADYVAKADDAASRAYVRIDSYDSSNKLISSCTSGRFKITGAGGLGGSTAASNVAASIALALGSLLTLIPATLITALSASPGLTTFLSRASALFAPPVIPAGVASWGVVYDSVNKKPLKGVVVRIFSEPNGKLRESQSTNDLGEFGFVVPGGMYSLVATKLGYSFPSHFVKGSTDGRFSNVYNGGEIEAEAPFGEERAQLNISIPLDRAKMGAFDASVAFFAAPIQRFFSIIRLPIMIVGTVASVYLIISYGRWYDYAIGAVYLALWGLEIANLVKPKTYGVISDRSGNPISLATIRAIDKSGKIRATMITGEDGKFNGSLPKGLLRFDVSKPGFKPYRSDYIQITKVRDISKLDFDLEKLQSNSSSDIIYHQEKDS